MPIDFSVRTAKYARKRARQSPVASDGACLLSKLLDAVLLVELVNAAAGVDQLLLAGVEGMALRADFDRDVFLGGAGLDNGAAGAADGGLLVLRMDSFLHCCCLLDQGCLDLPRAA